MPRPPTSLAVVVSRGLLRRCAYCGKKGIFESWFRLKKECPRCGFDFDREPGWWIGGMIINLAGAMALFAVILGLGLLIFWPDVPWLALAVVSALAMAAFPIIFYPISKAIWLGIDLLMVGDPATRT
jgi:uncharacterized protein (DUF983 family)